MVALSDFDKDVLGLDPVEVIQKHVTTGSAFAFPTDDAYFGLKKWIANKFGLHPSEVIVVGSAKLGFSIAPPKYGKRFGERSDIDVAIVSPELFDQYWKCLHAFDLSRGQWERKQEFCDYLFSGWIRPDKFPFAGRVGEADQWWDFFRETTASRRFGPYKISAGIYREWYFLETYQMSCVETRKRVLEVQANAGQQERPAVK